MKRRTVKCDEWDVVTGWRRLLIWRPGEVATIKRRMRRRERREGRTELRKDPEHAG
jgi:hypothetical protein